MPHLQRCHSDEALVHTAPQNGFEELNLSHPSALEQRLHQQPQLALALT